MKLTILISTYNERIGNVARVLLPVQDNVSYIVSHQYTSREYKIIPADLRRSDVIVSQIAGKGVTKSRNNAMELASGDVGLFADDDITYKQEYIDTVRAVFRENADTDVALFKIKTPAGEPEYKNYPIQQKVLKKLPHAVSTLEIAFRISRVKQKNIWFDERFGAGQQLLINTDETIFVEDCLRSGLKVVFVPEYVVEHPYQSTIKSIPKYDKRRNWVTGGYDCRTNGIWAMGKAFLGTAKILPDLIHHKVNPLVYCYHRLSAVLFILWTNRKQQKTG